MVRELGYGALSIAASTLGLLLIAVFYETAFEMSESWWTVILGFSVATAMAAIGILLIYGAMQATVAVTAAGWAGMFAGHVPADFGRGDNNLGRAVGNASLGGFAIWWGLGIRGAGIRDGQLNWSTLGLLLVGAGIVFGLLAAIPRFYFAVYGRADPVDGGDSMPRLRSEGQDEDRDDVAVLFTFALIALALSMCTTNVVASRRGRDGRTTLAYGEWTDGCVSKEPSSDCSAAAQLELIPRHSTRQRIEYLAKCPVVLTTSTGEPVKTVSFGEMHQLGVSRGDGSNERFRRMFEAVPGQRYRVSIKPATGTCTFSFRFLDEPTGPAKVVTR